MEATTAQLETEAKTALSKHKAFRHAACIYHRAKTPSPPRKCLRQLKARGVHVSYPGINVNVLRSLVPNLAWWYIPREAWSKSGVMHREVWRHDLREAPWNARCVMIPKLLKGRMASTQPTLRPVKKVQCSYQMFSIGLGLGPGQISACLPTAINISNADLLLRRSLERSCTDRSKHCSQCGSFEYSLILAAFQGFRERLSVNTVQSSTCNNGPDTEYCKQLMILKGAEDGAGRSLLCRLLGRSHGDNRLPECE